MSTLGAVRLIYASAIVSALLLISLAQLAFAQPVKDWYCIFSQNPLRMQEIPSSDWRADLCYNIGPNGEPSAKANEGSGQSSGGEQPPQMPQLPQGGQPQQSPTAQYAMSDKANAMCNPYYPQCPCNTVPGTFGCVAGRNTHACPVGVCYDQPIPDGVVLGICVEQNVCQGVTFTDLKGQTQGVDQKAGNILGDIFKGVLDKLMGGGGGGAGAGGGTGAPTGAAGCTQYYQVTTPTTDPCATYVPPTSSSLLGGGSNASNQLLQALSGGSTQTVGSAFETGGSGTGASVSSQIVSQLQSAQGSAGSQGQQGAQSSILLSSNLQQATTLPSGTRGDIQITGGGATIFAGSREGNTEVVGFYGADTFGTNQPQGLVARMCQTRPWEGSFISYVIPPSFFDGLCSWRGYTVGTPAAAPYTTPAYVQQTSSTPPPSATSTPVYSGIPLEVDIWAIPATVPLGARTSVFWNSKGAVSCTVTSSDGNFLENTLSGGAATVPVTGSTTFTASCFASDGSSITDTFTVHLSI